MEGARSLYVNIDGVRLPPHLGDVILDQAHTKRTGIFYDTNPPKWSEIPQCMRRDILLHQAIHIEGVRHPIPFVDGEWNRTALYNMNDRGKMISVHSMFILSNNGVYPHLYLFRYGASD